MNQEHASTRTPAEQAGSDEQGRYAGSSRGQDRFLGLLFLAAERAPRLLHALAGVLGAVVWWVAPGTRDAVRANLKRVLAETPAQAGPVGRRMIANFVRFVADLGTAQRLSPNELVERAVSIEGAEHYEQALAMGRGLIVATAHLGSYEVGLAVVASKSPATHVVFATDPFPRFDRLRRRLREKLGVHEARAERGWAMWSDLRDALGRGEVVVLQADRVMPGQKGARATLCGASACLPTGPVRLAQLAGAPIVPVFGVRIGGNRIKLVIEKPILVESTQATHADQQAALQQLADAISRQVRARPDQWLMLHRVWDQASNPS